MLKMHLIVRLISSWLAIFAASAILHFPANAADNDDDYTTRVLIVRVLDSDKRPEGGTTITLYGLDKPLAGQTWQFISDNQGIIRIIFISKRLSHYAYTHFSEQLPGKGIFRLVAEPGTGYAGGASPRIFVEDEIVVSEDELWLRDKVTTITLQLKKGIVIEGIVVDDNDKPTSGIPVFISYDIGVYSLIRGEGAYCHETLTGKDGTFRFENAYPDHCSVSVDSYWGKQWFRTRLQPNQPWIYDKIDHISITPQMQRGWIGIGLINRQFEIFGKVTDKNGAPITSATVVFWKVDHKEGWDWVETHNFLKFETDAKGAYRGSHRAPWFPFLGVMKKGKNNKDDDYLPLPGQNDKWFDNIAAHDPGRFDIQVDLP